MAISAGADPPRGMGRNINLGRPSSKVHHSGMASAQRFHICRVTRKARSRCAIGICKQALCDNWRIYCVRSTGMAMRLNISSRPGCPGWRPGLTRVASSAVVFFLLRRRIALLFLAAAAYREQFLAAAAYRGQGERLFREQFSQVRPQQD